jgi:hypothetical protein
MTKRKPSERAVRSEPVPAAPRKTPRIRLRPMAHAARISLFEKEVRERLSRAALTVLLDRADVLSEGQPSARAGRRVFVGSTMLTFDLAKLADVMREPVDARTAKRLAAQLEADADAQARVRAIAAREAARIVGAKPKSVSAELKVRARGARVFVDVDVEAVL